jgi:preprotein translocase subunit SecB
MSTMQFSVQTLYIKDISFECPNTPNIFNLEWKPKLEFDIQTNFVGIQQADLYDVTVHMTVSVKVPVSKEQAKHFKSVEEEFALAFLIDLKQGGIFLAKNFEPEMLQHVLSTAAPGIIYPYVRETISSLATRGGFPQLLMPPMNFEALYQHHLEEQKLKTAQNTEKLQAQAQAQVAETESF